MIISLSDGRKIDTERDLTAAERHVVQKLYAWQSLVDSAAAFREKRDQALGTGWNNSGPVAQRPVLQQIIEDLEASVADRLKKT